MGSPVDRIKDIGPQPQSFDIERATKENVRVLSDWGCRMQGDSGHS